MNNKKAQGLPLNTIVIAIIVLLVLIVIVYIFSAQIGDWVRGIKSCEKSGGICKPSCGVNERPDTFSKCPKVSDAEQKCCIQGLDVTF